MTELFGTIDNILAKDDKKETPAGMPMCWEVSGCPRSDYLACSAYQRRKNCYEVDRVICCSKHTDNCLACEVYKTINRYPIRRTKVRVRTDRFDVVGTVCVPDGVRLSDHLNASQRSFLVVTNADTLYHGDAGPASSNQVAMINRAHIIMVEPCDEG